MSVETAVLMSGGLSTGVWPAGTVTPKCLMEAHVVDDDPNKSGSIPIAHYGALECAMSGISRVIVIGSEQGMDQIMSFFAEDVPSAMSQRATELGKNAKLAEERARRDLGLEFEYIVQPESSYGTGYALALARPALRGVGRFIVMSSDDVIRRPSGYSTELSNGIDAWSKAETDNLVTSWPISREQSAKFGVMYVGKNGIVEEFAEKPEEHELPVGLNILDGSVSRYGFSENIYNVVDDQGFRPDTTGEKRITDFIIGAMEMGQTFYAHRMDASVTRRFDGGTSRGLLDMSNFLSKNPDYR